jgi:DNA topoisomerase-1
LLKASDSIEAPRDPQEAAAAIGLTYVLDAVPGIGRRRRRNGFVYHHADGRRADNDERILARIRTLAIPPAWTDVWICPSPSGHVQATGRDARGRKQYKYHSDFRQIREAAKYERLFSFARVLPKIRAQVKRDLALRGLPRRKVLAAVIQLLEMTLIRVGNDGYAEQNQSYGLTTLKNKHVQIKGSEIRFNFRGKSGKQWSLKLQDRRIARIVKSCQDLPGQELIQYVDPDGRIQDVASNDVNDYLREISGDDVTAKDFRTWAGTVLCALALEEVKAFESQAGAKRNLKAAVEKVAARLGNTPTICRKCYIHPDVVDLYLRGEFSLTFCEAQKSARTFGLQPAERAVLALLRRLRREKEKPSRSRRAMFPAPRARPAKAAFSGAQAGAS